MLVDDENDVRAGLRALSEAPPPQAGRVAAAVGRARRIRRRRNAVAAATVLLPAVALAAATLRPSPLPPPPTVDVANVANWPERRDPALAAVERNVFADWDDDRLNPGEQVRWLYSGRVPGTGSAAVAFATCHLDRCTRVVLAHGDPAAMVEPPEEDEATGWRTQTRNLVEGEPAGALSEYLDSAARPEEGPTTVLFVLAAPDAERVTYAAPRRDGRSTSTGALTPHAGAFSADIGYLEAHAVVTVARRDGSVVHQGLVGDEESVGNAREIEEIDLPPGYESRMKLRGQLGLHGDHMRDGAAGRGPAVVFVRCVGAEPLRVDVNGTKGRVPCDGRRREVGPVETVLTGGWDDGRPRWTLEYSLDSGDPYTVFAAAAAKRV